MMDALFDFNTDVYGELVRIMREKPEAYRIDPSEFDDCSLEAFIRPKDFAKRAGLTLDEVMALRERAEEMARAENDGVRQIQRHVALSMDEDGVAPEVIAKHCRMSPEDLSKLTRGPTGPRVKRGRAKARRKIALSMVEDDFPHAVIARYCGLTLTDVQDLATQYAIGVEHGKQEIVFSMLAYGCSREKIARLTFLPWTEVDRLAEQFESDKGGSIEETKRRFALAMLADGLTPEAVAKYCDLLEPEVRALRENTGKRTTER